MSKERLLIVGAGLCGTMLAIRMAQRNYHVTLVEKRHDMRSGPVDRGRSINLALSDRGWKALRLIGLESQIRREVIPMYGRQIHPVGGESWLSRYSGRQHEFINSVSRSGLNTALLNAAEKYNNLTVLFDMKCTGVDLKAATARFVSTRDFTRYIEADVIFGADGAGSAVRASMLQESTALRFNYSQEFLDHGYKELTIPPSETGAWRIEKNALHIWPRHDFMLIALPNLDGSFTVTLFLPFDGSPGFNQLRTPQDVLRFWEDVFPSAVPHMPVLAKDFFDNPTGTLGTIKCDPCQAGGNVLLIGDAAHAVVPFYGQGMNCALEDVVVLDALLDEHGGDWASTLEAYSRARKVDTDAIADLALENYYEMRDQVDDPEFILKRQLEMQLEQQYPQYSSKYNLVTFNENLPYSVAMERGHRQDAVLLRLCRQIEGTSEVDLEALLEKLQAVH